LPNVVMDTSSHRRVIVIGASLGGVSALKRLCLGLPKDSPAPICIVLHVGAHKSILPEILRSAGALPAAHARDGEPLTNGHIHIAPPDHHMRIDGDAVRISRGPKEHHSRPAIDPLFRSAARSLGPRAIGVVLTGLLDDGTAGMQAIKEVGGTCMVQDPNEAAAPSMPASVLKYVAVDHCIRLDEFGPLLSRLAAEPVVESSRSTEPAIRTLHEDDISLGLGDAMEHLRAIGRPSTFTCPDCGGSLWQIAGVSPQRFLCHTGHAFSLEALISSQSLATDETLWSALRALQEKRELLLRAMAVAETAAHGALVASLRGKVAALSTSAETLRALVAGVDETDS
jgi:two-component system chemotaxis response regulator CheB